MHILEFDTKYDMGRYRGIYLNSNGTQIILRTRNGGGNRECWCDEKDKHEQGCLTQVIEQLQKHPQYLSDEDDEFDATYADFKFKVPDKYLQVTKEAATGKDPETVANLSSQFIERIKNMPKEELETKFKPLTDIVKKIAEKTDA